MLFDIGFELSSYQHCEDMQKVNTKKACRVDEHRYHTKLIRESYCQKPLNMWTFASPNLRTCFLDYIIVKNKCRPQLVVLLVKEIQLKSNN